MNGGLILQEIMKVYHCHLLIKKEDSSKLIIHDAHQIKFSDKRLFWRGENAVGKPLLKSG